MTWQKLYLLGLIKVFNLTSRKYKYLRYQSCIFLIQLLSLYYDFNYVLNSTYQILATMTCKYISTYFKPIKVEQKCLMNNIELK